MKNEDVKPGLRVVVNEVRCLFDFSTIQSDYVANRRVGMIGTVLEPIDPGSCVWWVQGTHSDQIAVYDCTEIEPLPTSVKRPAMPTIGPCPCCGHVPTLRTGYDEKSGWGERNKGWIACGCGLSMAAPTPSQPFPYLDLQTVIRAWNTRTAEPTPAPSSKPQNYGRTERTAEPPRPIPKDAEDEGDW